MEALIIGVSDHHDGRAGRTVVGVTVRRKCPSLDTLKIFLETLIIEVSDHHAGRAGRTVVCMTARRKCPSLDTKKKFGDPFQRGL